LKGCDNVYDEAVVQALVLIHFGKCPDLGRGEFASKVTWCAVGDCPERQETNRRIKSLEEQLKIRYPLDQVK
jgi:hypothetical protein